MLHGALHTETYVLLIVAGDNYSIKALLRTHSIFFFVLLTVTCSPTISTECIVVFLLQ